MPIIYTYPKKIKLLEDDLFLISDSEDNKKTKNTKLKDLKNSLGVVNSLTAGPGISLSDSIGDITVSNTGVISLSNSFGTYISGNNNASANGSVNIGNIDLNAQNGSATSSTRFLTKDNTWAVPPVYSGGSNVGYVPSGGAAGQYLGGDGQWATATGSGTVIGNGAAGEVAFWSSANEIDGDSNFVYSTPSNENLLEIKGITDPVGQVYKNAKIKLGSTDGGLGGNPAAAGGEIELEAGGLAVGDNSVTIAAPRSPILSPYSIKLPTTPPQANNRILESDVAGNLSWIDTPSGTAAGGSDTQMQYNNNGAIGGTTGLTWDNTDNILSIDTRFEGDIDGAVLQQVIAKEALSKGDVVYISGGTGDNPEVRKAKANSASTMAALGIMKENVVLDAIGECVTSGEITGLDLTGFATGDELFVSNTTAGELIASAPTSQANLIQKIGKVIKGGPGGALTVLGAFRTNATPNLDQGSIFIGTATDQADALRIGASETVLTSDGTTASWETPKISAGTKTATSLGKAGELSFDSSYMYVCIANNQWRRISLGLIP